MECLVLLLLSSNQQCVLLLYLPRVSVWCCCCCLLINNVRGLFIVAVFAFFCLVFALAPLAVVGSISLGIALSVVFIDTLLFVVVFGTSGIGLPNPHPS